MNSIRIWASRIFLLASGFGAVPQIPGTGRDMFRNIGSIALLTWMMAVIGLLKYDRSKLRWWDYFMVASVAALLIYLIAMAIMGSSTSQIAAARGQP